MPDRSGPNQWFFDLWSRVYDAPVVQRLTYRPVQDAVMRELRRSMPDRVLDVGCGTGLLTSRIHAELAPVEVAGCDFSRGMLQQAAHGCPAVAWVRGNALRLPFRGGSFDAVVSTEAFHWFPDQGAALREFFRVLAPRGRLLLALVNSSAEWLSRASRRSSRLLGEPLNWPTRVRLRRQTKAAGFRVDAQTTVFRLPAPLIMPCVLTSATRPGGPETDDSRGRVPAADEFA
jgi:ubiquinone/menaquinone biosynthesis C-methylase UbiE